MRAVWPGLVAALLVAPGFAFASDVAAKMVVLTGVASVIDGDTLEVHGQRVRLHGIDAPESDQPCIGPDLKPWRCGQKAALALADRIGRDAVVCRRVATDRYGRAVATCQENGQDLNAWMVSQGWAVAYRQYALDYVAAENEARAAGRGIWSSRFEMPWDWRRKRRDGPRPTADIRHDGAACVIKGNVNSQGGRIYHLPGGRGYEKTKISPAKGERWFCSEEEARSSGWRRAAE